MPRGRFGRRVAWPALRWRPSAIGCVAARPCASTSTSIAPRALLRLAQQQWRDGGGIDAAAALPLYLRDKVALTVAEREALRRAEHAA